MGIGNRRQTALCRGANEIARAEIQYFCQIFTPGVVLHGGWAGVSMSADMQRDADLVQAASIIAALELNLAGETDILPQLLQRDGVVPESYIPGSASSADGGSDSGESGGGSSSGGGSAGMHAEQHIRRTSLGDVLYYSLSRQ